MRKLAAAAWPCALLLLAGACRLPTLQAPAPLSTRGQHPAQLTVMHAMPRAARAVPAGELEARFGVDWTSLWLQPGGGTDRIELDGELLRASVATRMGLGHGLDLEVEVSAMHSGGGVLDRFIEGWHDLFGFAQSERDEHPRDQFGVSAERRTPGGSQPAYELQDEAIALGDLPVTLAWFPIQEGGFGLGLRAGIELPTGDESKGYGNGGLDAMLGFAGGWSRDWLAVFAWGGWTLAATPDRAQSAGLDYANPWSLGAGAELGLLPWLAAVAQVEWEPSVLRDLDDRHARPDQVVVWMGGRLRLSERMSMEGAVGEDLSSSVAADVTFHLRGCLRL